MGFSPPQDRVQETTTTTGTGALTLLGAVSGYQAISVKGDGNKGRFCVAGGTEWEIFEGTYTLATTSLSRDKVIASSNNGLAVNLSAGTKNVFEDIPASQLSVLQSALLQSWLSCD